MADETNLLDSSPVDQPFPDSAVGAVALAAQHGIIQVGSIDFRVLTMGGIAVPISIIIDCIDNILPEVIDPVDHNLVALRIGILIARVLVHPFSQSDPGYSAVGINKLRRLVSYGEFFTGNIFINSPVNRRVRIKTDRLTESKVNELFTGGFSLNQGRWDIVRHLQGHFYKSADPIRAVGDLYLGLTCRNRGQGHNCLT